MTAEDGGGEQGATVPTIVNGQRVDRPAGLVAASRTQADIDRYGTGWQEWYVSPASIDNLTGVSIKCGEFYATAWGTNGKMVFNRRAIGPGEVWRLHHQDNGVALQAYNDKFVCAERDAQGNVTGEVNVNRDAPGEWETFTATGLTVGGGSSAVGGGPTAPLAYPVAIDGRFFRVPIVGASMLYAASPLIDYRAALDENQALGFNAVRLFCGQLEQVGQDVGGSLYSRLAQIARDCLDRRILLYAAYNTNAQSGYDILRHSDNVYQAFRGMPNILHEVANESDHPTQGGRMTLDMMKRVRDGKDGVWTLSADIRDGDLSTRLMDAFYAFHYGRDKGIEALSKNAEKRDQVNRAAANQEPLGADETNQPGKRSNDSRFFGDLGVANHNFGFAGFFHSEAGLNARPLGPVQRQCAVNFIKGSLTGSF